VTIFTDGFALFPGSSTKGFSTMTHRASPRAILGIFSFAPFILVAFLLLVFATGAPASGDLPPTSTALTALGKLKLGDTIPWFASQTAERRVINRTLLLREIKAAGYKGFVMNFFATWCVPCREGLKMLGKERERLEAAGIRVYLVDVSRTGNAPDGFLGDLNLAGITVLPDPYAVISRDFGMMDGKDLELALPKTFVVAADGRIRAIFAGEGQDYINRIIQGK
jgi:peroxiredoxin